MNIDSPKVFISALKLRKSILHHKYSGTLVDFVKSDIGDKNKRKIKKPA